MVVLDIKIVINYDIVWVVVKLCYQLTFRLILIVFFNNKYKFIRYQCLIMFFLIVMVLVEGFKTCVV